MDLESGEYVPVGPTWKFDLEKTFSLDFGVKCSFQEFELSMSCSGLSRQLKISEKQDQQFRSTNVGKLSKIAAGNCYLQLPIHNSNESRLSYSWQKTEKDREWRGSNLEWTRVSLRWKGGQLKLPNGPDQ